MGCLAQILMAGRPGGVDEDQVLAINPLGRVGVWGRGDVMGNVRCGRFVWCVAINAGRWMGCTAQF